VTPHRHFDTLAELLEDIEYERDADRLLAEALHPAGREWWPHWGHQWVNVPVSEKYL